MAGFSSSIPSGRAEREEGAVGARILDAALHLGQREQLGAQGGEAGAAGADRLDPVSVEQAWRGGTGHQADVWRQAVCIEPVFQPIVGLPQSRLAGGDL